VEDEPVRPTETWSLRVTAKWIEPLALISNTSLTYLSAWALADAAARQLRHAKGVESTDLSVLDILVTHHELFDIGQAAAGWLGSRHVREIAVPQEPDGALLADEMAGVSIVLTPVLHGGGSTVPILRGLLAAGRALLLIGCLVDGRADPAPSIAVAGHEVPVISLVASSLAPTRAQAGAIEERARERLTLTLDRGVDIDKEFIDAVANSPGALALGHFHTENRAWMATLVAPRAIADPRTDVGRLVRTRLVERVAREVKALGANSVRVRVEDLASPTPLTAGLRRALLDLYGEPQVGATVRVLVDWGALSGETAVRGAANAAMDAPDAVIVAVGVDRAASGTHHLLTGVHMSVHPPKRGQLTLGGDDLEEEERLVRLSFVAAASFARDHRSEVDCPLCAAERSIVGLTGSMPETSVNARLSRLRARTARDPIGVETYDAFGCAMSVAEIRLFLVWRSVIHLGFDDVSLAHGVVLHLENEKAARLSDDLLALSRVFVVNPNLFRRRPWSSPRFRTSFSEALRGLLHSEQGIAIDSDMARQVVTALRMTSKTAFALSAGQLYAHWKSRDVREEIEISVASMLKPNISSGLLNVISECVEIFEQQTEGESQINIGSLKAAIQRLKLGRYEHPDVVQRWLAAKELLRGPGTHMGVGLACERLRVVHVDMAERRRGARTTVLLNDMIQSVGEIERFISLYYGELRVLVDPEVTALVDRGLVERPPDTAEWLATVERLRDALERARDASGALADLYFDVDALVVAALAPLDQDAATIAAMVQGVPTRIEFVIGEVKDVMDGRCIVDASEDCRGDVLFPARLLHDLVEHLAGNAVKHGVRSERTPSLRLTGPRSDVPGFLTIRASYVDTTARGGVRSDVGGLSDKQWGGAVAAFGGTVESVEPSAGESFAVEVSLPITSRE
jgi:hypothetical protein